MSVIINSTEARKNFFDLLNRVLYGDEDVYIKKAGSDYVVKLEKVKKSKPTLSELAGSLSKKDAEPIRTAIEAARDRKKRVVRSF